MNKARLLAACGALVLTAAACGDDDDDDASGDTTPVTVAAAPTTAGGATTPATAAAPAAGATTPATDDGGAAATVAAAPTLPGGDATEEQVADCQLIAGSLQDALANAPADPGIDEEISDEYKDYLQNATDELDDLDLSTDEVQAGVDSVVDFGNEVIDADTWTEELNTASQDAFTPLLSVCGATFASSAAGG
jgi:hypothetical protein